MNETDLRRWADVAVLTGFELAADGREALADELHNTAELARDVTVPLGQRARAALEATANAASALELSDEMRRATAALRSAATGPAGPSKRLLALLALGGLGALFILSR